MDVILLVCQTYGQEVAKLNLDEYNKKKPNIYDAKKHEAKYWKRRLWATFGSIPSVFPTDREKITYVYHRTQGYHQKQIKEIVEEPVKNRTFDYMFLQVIENDPNNF
ncbi:uncharacterized protein SOCG_06263 [Schizosaccharomyces octosporus yFS286]|uniref:Uncharacterized protein n=1 Tax=Schizosaccharomyces octosporus (strain yFS286) TaxID=483514 RepID=S9PVF1_SCHOY|nr:uncharacterized protein SOCG_06263 [Schizosaccharomyces octosporus yFS286]EPX73071.1 hypothetical protein SOCG_06263 [Schizosaccharomyces octosporus yFS286]